ncbi:MAG: hypothetical protein ACRBFS_21245 [Aureispira sp.]
MALYRLLLIGVLLMSYAVNGVAQPAQYKKIVQLHFQDIPLTEVLQQLKTEYDIQFSYSNDHLPLQQKINYFAHKQPLNKAIKQLFKENDIICAYIGKQYVLKPNLVRQRKRKERKKRKKERSTREQETLDRERLFNIDIHSQLLRNKPPAVVEEPQIRSTKEIKPLTATRIGTTTKPIVDSTDLLPDAKFRPKIRPRIAQVSLFPFLSTNGRRYQKAVNITSFNLLWRRNGSVKGLEIGGIGNDLYREMQGLQIGGFFNRVEGEMQGIQIAGLFNLSKGTIIGLQYSAGVNMGTDVYGMQGTILSNVARDLYGLQFSGVSNIATDVYGCQTSGFFNFANGKLFGSQIAGLGNIAWGGKSAVQFAGLFNYSAKAQFQIASFLNMAQYIDGAQLGLFNAANRQLNGCQIGVLNRTNELNGCQIGLINSANKANGFLLGLVNVVDSIQGVSLGLINIVKRNGYNRIEIGTGDILYFQLGAKFGLPRLYQVAQVGWQVNAENNYVWSVGGGLGTALPLTKHLQTNFELVLSKINEDIWWQGELNLLQQLKINLDIKIQERVSLFIGPVLNVHVSRSFNTDTQTYGSNLAPYTLLDATNAQGTNLKLWIGIGGGLRF